MRGRLGCSRTGVEGGRRKDWLARDNQMQRRGCHISQSSLPLPRGQSSCLQLRVGYPRTLACGSGLGTDTGFRLCPWWRSVLEIHSSSGQERGFKCFGGPGMMILLSYIGCFRALCKDIQKKNKKKQTSSQNRTLLIGKQIQIVAKPCTEQLHFKSSIWSSLRGRPSCFHFKKFLDLEITLFQVKQREFGRVSCKTFQLVISS